MTDKDILIELRDKYAMAIETKDVSKKLSLGICCALDNLIGDNLINRPDSPIKNLLIELINKGIIIIPTNDGSWLRSYYWPVYLYTKNIDMSLTPRLEALNIMIKYLTDEKDITKD